MDIELVPFGREDFRRLIDWVPDEAFLMQWAGTSFEFPHDEAQLEAYLRPTQGERPTRLAFKAVDRSSGVAVGHIELNNIDRKHRSARVARVLVGEASKRRQGIGTEMVHQVLRIGFERLGLHRIELLVFEFNQAAIACYEKAGFVREGLLRQARWHRGQFWDLLLLSILEQEWKEANQPGGKAASRAGGAPPLPT
ncbi:MAG: GNAT family protein [Chloroflexota bacterium]